MDNQNSHRRYLSQRLFEGDDQLIQPHRAGFPEVIYLKLPAEPNRRDNTIHDIIDIELKKLYARIADIGYDLTLSDKAKDYIAEKGFDKQYGARPLKRAIQKYIEDALAEEIVNAKLNEGDSINMDLDEEHDKLTISIKKASKSSKEA